MKPRLMMAAALLGVLPLNANELPELSEKPWVGSWIANAQREFDYSVSAQTGRGWIYPKVRKSEGYVHAGIHDKFQVVFILEEMKGGVWKRITMTEDGFETDQKSSDEVEECDFVASYEDGSKVRIHHRFERKEIIVSTELVHKASENPMRAGVLVLTPSVYGVLKHRRVPDQNEIEDLMDDDEIRAVRVDGKKFKFKLHEEVKLSDTELLKEGATEYSLGVKRYGGKPITMSSSAKGGGKIFFSQTNRLFEPYRVTWYPTENKKPAQGAELVISFK